MPLPGIQQGSDYSVLSCQGETRVLSLLAQCGWRLAGACSQSTKGEGPIAVAVGTTVGFQFWSRCSAVGFGQLLGFHLPSCIACTQGKLPFLRLTCQCNHLRVDFSAKLQVGCRSATLRVTCIGRLGCPPDRPAVARSGLECSVACSVPKAGCMSSAHVWTTESQYSLVPSACSLHIVLQVLLVSATSAHSFGSIAAAYPAFSRTAVTMQRRRVCRPPWRQHVRGFVVLVSTGEAGIKHVGRLADRAGAGQGLAVRKGARGPLGFRQTRLQTDHRQWSDKGLSPSPQSMQHQIHHASVQARAEAVQGGNQVKSCRPRGGEFQSCNEFGVHGVLQRCRVLHT